jgi:hypothetical protein
VILAAAHLDRDPTNNEACNLKALCRRCDMLQHRGQHRRQRWLTLRGRKAARGLFLSPYLHR